VPDRGDKATAVHPCRRKTAGAVILGKTNVPVDYRRYQVKGDIYPEGKNPYGLEYSPGGSTGGGAAAVAAGMTALELGADGGGSLRVPAHFCGVFCLKPTDKTIPRYGMVPPPRRGFLVSLVQAGPLGRSIDDLELLWEIIRGPEPSDFEIHRSTGIHRQAIRSINSASPGPMGSSRTSRAPRRASSSLHWRLGSSARGLTSRRQRLRFILAPTRCSSSCLVHSSDRTCPGRCARSSQYSPRAGCSGASRMSSSFCVGALRMNTQDYAAALGIKRAWVEEMERFFGSHDVLLAPVSYGPAFKRCKEGSPLDFDGELGPYNDYCEPYVAPFNASGHPALVMPLGTSKEGLPVGVQLVGPYWSEPELLHIARQLAPLTQSFVAPQGF
jgi:amidase